VDSEVEKRFAKRLDERDDVKFFLKLPSWFKINTPLGGYNPDWAIVREESKGVFLYFVRETKGGNDLDKLRFEHEKLKIKFGAAHFKSIDVDYAFGEDPDELIGPEPKPGLSG
jgi:type III restriction enzyme